MHEKHPKIIKSITAEKKILDDVFEQMKTAVETFNQDHPEWMVEAKE